MKKTKSVKSATRNRVVEMYNRGTSDRRIAQAVDLPVVAVQSITESYERAQNQLHGLSQSKWPFQMGMTEGANSAPPPGLLKYLYANTQGQFSDIEEIEDMFDYAYLEDLDLETIADGAHEEKVSAAKWIKPRLDWLLGNMNDSSYKSVFKPLAIAWMKTVAPAIDQYIKTVLQDLNESSLNEDEYDWYENGEMDQEAAVAAMFTRLASQGIDPLDKIAYRFGWSSHELDDLAQVQGFNNSAEWLNSFGQGVAEGQLNEYLVQAGMPVADVLALNLFQDFDPMDGLAAQDHEYAQNKQWQQVVRKYAPIANMLKKKLLATKRPLTDAEAEAVEETWYDGSDAYDDFEIEYLIDIYNQQIDTLEALLAGNLTDEELFEQGVAEGLGKTIKRSIAGWGAFDKDKPKDVVNKVKGQDTDVLKRLHEPNTKKGKGSPAELQQKAIGRELKKREQGVSETNVAKYRDLGATNDSTHFVKNVTTGKIVSPHRSRRDAEDTLVALQRRPDGNEYRIVRARKDVAEAEYDSSRPYGVRYRVFAGRDGRLTTKEFWTTSSEKLEKAVAKIEALGNFYEIDGYSYPKEQQSVSEEYTQVHELSKDTLQSYRDQTKEKRAAYNAAIRHAGDPPLGMTSTHSSDEVDQWIKKYDKMGSGMKKAANRIKKLDKQSVAEGDDRGDYHSTARAAEQATRQAKDSAGHKKAADLHDRAATFALSAGQDSSVIHDHQMAAREHSRAARGVAETRADSTRPLHKRFSPMVKLRPTVPDTMWEVEFEYGPDQYDSVKVRAKSAEEAGAKVERAQERIGRSIDVDQVRPVKSGVAEGSESKKFKVTYELQNGDVKEKTMIGKDANAVAKYFEFKYRHKPISVVEQDVAEGSMSKKQRQAQEAQINRLIRLGYVKDPKDGKWRKPKDDNAGSNKQDVAEGSLEEAGGAKQYNEFKREWRAKHGADAKVPGYDSREYTSYCYRQRDKKQGVAESWYDSDPEQHAMDATRRSRLSREREPRGSEAIDDQLRAEHEYKMNQMPYWIKIKATGEYVGGPYTGMIAASQAAREYQTANPDSGEIVLNRTAPPEQSGSNSFNESLERMKTLALTHKR